MAEQPTAGHVCTGPSRVYIPFESDPDTMYGAYVTRADAEEVGASVVKEFIVVGDLETARNEAAADIATQNRAEHMAKFAEKYPASAKLAQISHFSAKIKEFLDFLAARNVYLGTTEDARTSEYMHRVNDTHADLLAAFFEIDMRAVEMEKRAALANLQVVYDAVSQPPASDLMSTLDGE